MTHSFIVEQAEFAGSFAKLNDCPQTKVPEFAFIGRSNVGKSSLINYFVNKKGLAKTSQRPGKTQTINFFNISKGKLYFVDLPGYGYAKVSKSQRFTWGKMIEQYLRGRKQLSCVFVLIDASIEPKSIDIDFLKFLGQNNLAFAVLFTKIDKAKQQEVARNTKNFQLLLTDFWEELPPIFFTSAEKKTGKIEILEFMSDWLAEINSKGTGEPDVPGSQ